MLPRIGRFLRALLVALRREQPTHEDYRTIEIRTAGTWPSPAELALRDVVEKAVADSRVAETLGAEAGSGSISIFVQLRGASGP